MDNIPELVARKIVKGEIEGNFAKIKRLTKWCHRCGEPFITDLHTQAYCPTCRGGEMGREQARRFMENWNHGVMVGTILEDMRR